MANYQCQACGQSFNSAEELQAHNRKEHGAPSGRPGQSYKCEACGQTFNSAEELRQHAQARHPEKVR